MNCDYVELAQRVLAERRKGREAPASGAAEREVPDLHPGDRVVWTMTPPAEVGVVTSRPGWTEWGWFIQVRFPGKFAACSVVGLQKIGKAE